MLLVIVEVFIAFLAIFYAYYYYHQNYWGRKGFPFLKPNFPFGNLPVPFLNEQINLGVHMKNLYHQIRKNGWRHGGIYFFATPMYMAADLDYLKNILTKDFEYFSDRGTFYNEKDDPLSAHLFAIGGVKWKNLRAKLTPTFTSGKMKSMFHTLVECEKLLVAGMEKLVKNNEPVDVKDITGRFTTDIIGSCAFGIECNSFAEEEESLFRKYGKNLFKFSKPRRLLITFAVNFPKFGRAIGVRFFQKEVSDFFMKMVTDTVNYRETNNIVRKDFLQLLIDMKNNKIVEEEGYKHDGRTLTMQEVAAQCVLFFLAGFETSSSAMTFTLYALARHQDIQEKVREEIKRVLEKYDGEITYDGINEMKYLQQVIDESLRLYPAIPFVTRLCVKDYKFPDSDLVIEKPTRIIIPIYGIHHDPEYWPNPEKFDPDRFSEENKRNIRQYSYLPFGEGQRTCIGMRFGLMQTKVGLTSLLKNYRFTVNDRTHEPLKMSTTSFVLAVEGDVWLNAEKIE